MKLLLWRHAEAEDPCLHQADHERRLTPYGEKQARRIARWLHQKGHQSLASEHNIYSSPATRCQQTARKLALPYDVEPRLGLDAGESAMLTFVQSLIAQTAKANGTDTVLLVGHQPMLGRLAAWLMTGETKDWSFRKGALWWFNIPEDQTSRTGMARLKAVIDPGLL